MTAADSGSFSSIFGEERGKMKVTHQEIAAVLLEEGFLLTALEFHTELLESGEDLRSLKDFFSNSQNFSSCVESRTVSPGTPSSRRQEIRRSESQVTLDSIDRLTRYSEETDRREEDRLAVLEYEVRTGRETITQLRAELQELTKSEQNKTSLGDSSEEEKEDDEEELQIKPHEKKFLNHLVNDYLMRNGYKFTAVTFSDECDQQNFDDWEEVSSYSVGNPTILSIYRNSGFRQLTDRSNLVSTGAQTFCEVKVVEEKEWLSLNSDLQNLTAERDGLLQQVEAHIRTNSQLREELKTKLDENEAQMNDMKTQISELETERLALTEKVKDLNKMSSQSHQRPPAEHDITRPEHEREDGDGASIIDEPMISPSVSRESDEQQKIFVPKSFDQYVFQSFSEIPRPVSQTFQTTFLRKVFPISIDESSLDHIDISEVLATTLPKLISNLVLSSRIDIVPLLLYSISCQKDLKTRENLIGVLFNLMKKPDESTRQKVLFGLLWLVHQPGWVSKRIEEELLPQCLDQMNQKYNEKKILVGQSLAVLATYIDRTIRCSLLISMVLQLLNDKDPEVVITGVRSLAVLINLVDDQDKMEQVYNVVVSILTNSDTPEDISEEIQSSVMPVINVWLAKAGRTLRFVERLFSEIEKQSVLESLASLDDTAAVDEAIESKESIVQNLSLIESQMNSVVSSVINSCPAEPSQAQLNANEKLEAFNSFTSQDWFKPWPEYEQFMEFLLRLSKFFQNIPPRELTIIDCCSKLLSFIIESTGPNFAEAKVFPVIESSITSSSAILSIFCISLTRDNSSFPSHAMSLVTTWTVRMAKEGGENSGGSSCSPLFPILSFLCKEKKQSMVIESLRELVADPSASVRREVGSLLSRLTVDCAGPVVSRMLVPAVLSLTSDPGISVKISAVPALISLLSLTSLEWEDKERLSLQVRSLLEDEEEVAVVTAQEVAEMLSWCEVDIRDQMVIPELCRGVRRCWDSQELLASLLACFSVISQLQESETILSGFVLPSLADMLEAARRKYPDLESSVISVISELEASRGLTGRSCPPGGAGAVEGPGREKRDSISSVDQAQSGSDRMKEKVNKLFSKQSNINFWKK